MTNQTKTNNLNYLIHPRFAMNLYKQIELENPNLKQQIRFIGKLEADRAAMFFIIEKSEETTFEFLQNSDSII